MTFYEVLDQVVALLQRQGRVSYRALKREFHLDDEYLEDLKEELIGAKRLATDEEGRFLVWRGEQAQAGVPSRPPASPVPTAPVESRAPDAERRQLTVEFIDLVGSTQLSAQLDPEELREVVRAYQQTCAEVIQRYEGHIAQYLGDGVLVYFGYPIAHEDDAARAVRAGLEIIDGIGQQQSSNGQQGQALQVRIGIHTGPVVVGEIGGGARREQLALGETPNVAARVQSVATPNTLVLSAATHRLLAGLFDCQNLGTQTLKGLATPVTVYQVLHESTVQHRLDTAPPTGLTPLVGREEELALLQRRWEQVKDREGQVVLLSGEPGIGKSRLVRELRNRVEQDGALRLEFRCSPYYQNSALHPVIEHLQRLLHWQKEDTPQTKRDKLQATLARYRFPQTDTLALLAALLSLLHPPDAPPLNLSSQRQKEKTEEALIAWLLEEAEQAPVYCVWEDVHWADPSTLELLGRFIEQASTTRLFVLLTSRPEFTSPWGKQEHFSQLTLSRLGRRQAPQLIEKATGGKTLPSEVMQQIVAKTDGVPLFVEELTKMVVESELLTATHGGYKLSGPLLPLAIPSTLQDSLMARLDRLASVREIAQLGATLGREFSYELLRAVSPWGEQALHQGLRQLMEVELLYQRGTPPQSTYVFKHALIQDTAYHALLKSKRQQYHQRIAQVLEAQFPDITATQPELVAHHYTEANLAEQAIPYWQWAGQRAIERSAYAEAIRHLTTGLEVLRALPDTPARTQQELTLHLALGAPLIALKGWGAPEVEQAYTRAWELYQQVGQTPQLFPVLGGLCVFRLVRAELEVARELMEQLLSMAQRSHEPAHLLRSYELGSTLLWLGEVVSGQAQFELGITLSPPQQYRSPAALYGEDPGVFCRANSAYALWLLGFPDQAWQRSQEAITLAQELSHPFSLAYALHMAAMLSQGRREDQAVQEWAEAVMALATEQGFPFFTTMGTLLQGWALTEQARRSGRQGQEEERVGQMRRGLTAYRATGAGIWQPYLLALLAEVYGEGGQANEGLRVVAEALTLIEKTHERWWEAELYRLRGVLTLQLPIESHPSHVAEAEGCFLKAIEIAQKQQAKSLELRATMSLARLWRQQGKKEEARKMLAEIYGWFTEGFDTKDLQEAKALLEELT